MSDEIWRAVPGYEGAYEVSSEGRVRSLDRLDAAGARRRGRELSARRVNHTHLMVTLRDGARHDVLVHRLVLETFVGPSPDGTEACHWNDDPTDNRLENLRWDTRSANQFDSVRNGTHFLARRTHCSKGHEFTPDNTYRRPTGRRACRECRRQGKAALYQTRRAA